MEYVQLAIMLLAIFWSAGLFGDPRRQCAKFQYFVRRVGKKRNAMVWWVKVAEGEVAAKEFKERLNRVFSLGHRGEFSIFIHPDISNLWPLPHNLYHDLKQVGADFDEAGEGTVKIYGRGCLPPMVGRGEWNSERNDKADTKIVRRHIKRCLRSERRGGRATG